MITLGKEGELPFETGNELKVPVEFSFWGASSLWCSLVWGVADLLSLL